MSLTISDLAQEWEEDKEQIQNMQHEKIVEPINEIFICFGLEEYFEGDPNMHSFDIVEHLFDDEEEYESIHTQAILKKRQL